MPIATETLKDQYTCDGITNGPYAITWEWLDLEANYTVTHTDADTGVNTVLTLTTHYTRSGDNITTVETYPINDKITIHPTPPITQTWNPVEGDSFDPDTVAAKLDKLTLISKMIKELIDRVVKIPVSDPAATLTLPSTTERALQYLGFDGAGNILVGNPSASLASAFMQTVLDDISAAAARTTMSLYSQAEVDALVEAGGVAASMDSQTIDAAVEVGDPVFKNVTIEIVDRCDAVDWTDDAEITTSSETTNVKLATALRFTKDTGASVTAAAYKTLAEQIDFASTKFLNLFLYIDDAATLAKIAASGGVVIRYGTDSSNYYEWTVDRADLSAGWNTINGLTHATGAVTGAPGSTSYDYIYVALVSVASSDTWAAGKVVVDHIFVYSDIEWQLATEDTPSPQGIMTAAGTIQLSGYTDLMSDLIPGKYYWMKADGSWTTEKGESYIHTKLGYSLSDTEFIVDIDIEGAGTSQTITAGRGGNVKGYSMGGEPGTDAVESLTFADDSVGAIAGVLSTNRWSGAAVMNDSAGYLMGTTDGAGMEEIQKFTFTTESGADLGDTLDVAKYEAGACFSATKGWSMGGFNGAYKNWIDDFVFATELSERNANTLSALKGGRIAGLSHTGPVAYLAGGLEGAAYTNKIEEFTYATEVAANHSDTLDEVQGMPAGVYGDLAGYVMGDITPDNQIGKIVFATGVASQLVDVIVPARSTMSSISSTSKGFGAGGNTGAASKVVDGIVFSTEAVAVLGDELDVATTYPIGTHY